MTGARLAVAASAIALAAGLVAGQEPARPATTNLTIFAGTAEGLWRSQDWGVRFERVEGAQSGVSLREAGAALSILATGSRVWAGFSSGLYTSVDFGETWAPTGVTVPVHAVMPSRYPQADPTVFVGTAAGLLRSEDGGRTFHGTPLTAAVTRMEWPGPALVVATADGVRVSTDGAATFAPVGSGLPPGEVRALALSSFFAADPVAFAGVASRGVFRSSDGGRTWAPSGLDGKTVTDLAWLGPLLYAATDAGLFRSEDAGRTWSALGEGLRAIAAHRLLFPLAPDSGAEAFLATDDGIFRTGDGGERWQSGGLRGQRVLCLATFPPPSQVKAPKGRRR